MEKCVEAVNEIKRCFFEKKINKTDISLNKFTKRENGIKLIKSETKRKILQQILRKFIKFSKDIL